MLVRVVLFAGNGGHFFRTGSYLTILLTAGCHAVVLIAALPHRSWKLLLWQQCGRVVAGVNGVRSCAYTCILPLFL